MNKTSTTTMTFGSCCTALASIWSNKFAPSDAMSRRVLFFCLSLLIVAGSYTSVMATGCPTVNQGPGTTPSGCTQNYVSGGAGAYWTVTFPAGLYTITFNNNGNPQTGGYYCINGTPYSATQNINLSGSTTIGFYESNTSWSGTSAVLYYQPVTPTAGTVTQSPASGGTVCNGSGVTYTMSTPTNGSFSYFQYQWNASPPNSGAWGTTNPYTWGSGLNGASVLYVDAVVTNGTCTATSNIVNVTVQSTTNNVGAITAPSAICLNGSATISQVTASTTGTPASAGPYYDYYWERTTAPVTSFTSFQTGNGNTTAPLPTAVTGTAGTYMLARNSYWGCAAEASAPFLTLTVYPAFGTPTISGGTSPICTGGSPGTLTVSGSGGSGSYSYLWYLNGVSTGVTATTYTPTLTTVGTNTVYCTVTDANGCGSANSNTLSFTVNAQPSLTTPTPATQTDCNGATPTNITTTSSGGAGTITYQWYSNTSNTNSGGTTVGTSSTTLTPPTTTTGNAYYYCKMSATGNGCTAATSPLNDALVTVYGTQGMSLTGGVASPSLCQNTTLGTNTVYTISGGATSASITAGALPTGMSGVFSGSTFTISGTPSVSGSFPYTVTTSGTGGCSPVSLSGTITVNPIQAIALTTGNSSQSVCSGVAIATISYTLSGGATGASVSGLPAGLSGAVSGSTYSITGTPTVVSGSYPFTVTTSGTCAAATATGTITVNPNQTITLTSGSATPPEFCQGTPLSPNTVYTLGGGATGVASATGLPTGITYSVSGSTVTLSGTPTVNGTFNYNIFTNGNCSGTYTSGTIVVSPTNQATAGSTTSATVCAATTPTYTVPSGYSSSGGTVLWTSASTSGSPGSITAGSTGYTPTYTFSSNEVANGATITLTMTVSNAYCTSSTQTFTIHAYGATAATRGGTTSANVCAATTPTYTVPSGYSATNGTILWTRSSTSGTPGSITAGSTTTTPTYTFSANEIANGATITLTMTVSNAGCASSTTTFTINAYGAPTATAGSTTSANVCAATSSTYTVPSGYSSTNGTVLWTSSSTAGTPGSITAGATGYTPTYTFSSAEVASNATITLTMTVSNPAGCTSATKTFTINAYAATAANPGSTTSANVCAGTVATYTVPSGYSATNGTILWTRSSTSGTPGSITAGSTSTTPTYTFSANEIANGATITLTMTVSNAGGCTSTTTFTINAYGAPTETDGSTTSANVCSTTSSTYTVPAGYSSTNGTVLWTSSSTSGTPGSITAGATGYTPTYTFSSDEITNGATITLTITVSNIGGCRPATSTFTINVYGATAATPGSTTSANVCAGTVATYTVPSGYSATNGTILWTRSSTSGSPGSITAGSTTTTPTYTFSSNEIANGATITLTMTVSNPGGCTPSTTTFTINAYGAPTATAGSTTSAVVCAATSSTYTVPSGYSSTNGTVLWTSGSTSGTPGSVTAGSTGYTPTYTFSSDEIANGATITLTMTVSNAAGCAPATRTFIISAYPATSATAGSTTSATVCSYTSSYTVPSGYSSGTGSSVVWTASSTSGTNGTISGGTGYTPTYTFSTADKTSATAVTVTLTMTASNGGCTSSTATFTLTISPTPALSNQTSTQCSSVSFTYTPSGGIIPSGTSYTWSAPTGSGFSGSSGSGSGGSITDDLVNTTSSPVTATYSVTPTAGSCTGTAFNVAVTLNPSPSAASLGSVFDQCNGGWAAQVNITGGTSPYNFTLTYGGTPYSLTNKTVPYDQDLGGATTATLTALTDANGCPSSTVITGSPVTLPAPTATLSTLSSGSNSATCVVNTGGTQTFFDASANLMVQITPTANLGSTQVIITNDGSPGEFGPTHLQHYLQRHIQILPTNQATANVCIYMADAEVNALATISGSSDIHTPPVSYGTFPTSGVSPSTFLAGARIMEYDGASETPSSHTTETILTGSSATHNPTVDGVTYTGVWQLCYSSGFSGFYVYATNSTGDPLPVTLVSFTAEAVNNQYIELDWVTASEINNSGFQIERSTDGTNYQSIGWVDGHGTSTVTNDYIYSDLTAIPGIVYYYRLKQVDVDGNFAYSNIASASLTGDKGFTLTGLYPNPATSQVSIGVISNVNTSATVRLTDILGRDVMVQNWTLSVGYNTNMYDVSSLAAGTYVVTIQSGNVKTSKHLVITK